MDNPILFMFSAKSQCKKMNTLDLFMFSGNSSPPSQMLGIQTIDTKNLTQASLEARVRFFIMMDQIRNEYNLEFSFTEM